MNLTVKIDGLDQLSRSSRMVRQSVEREMQIGLKLSSEKVRESAIESILSGNKSGRTYVRGSVTHRASAKGEAPANDTGRLASSIITIQNSLEALVIAGRGMVRYASFLEFGTTKMGERPFMMPALEKNRTWIIDRLKRAVRIGIERGAK